MQCLEKEGSALKSHSPQQPHKHNAQFGCHRERLWQEGQNLMIQRERSWSMGYVASGNHLLDGCIWHIYCISLETNNLLEELGGLTFFTKETIKLSQHKLLFANLCYYSLINPHLPKWWAISIPDNHCWTSLSLRKNWLIATYQICSSSFLWTIIYHSQFTSVKLCFWICRCLEDYGSPWNCLANCLQQARILL